ncbi:MAG: hypothetical protein AAF270_05850 [Pseudomonadota bacterium]
MRRLRLLAITALLPLCALANDDNACLDGETAAFGRYVGDWKITDEALAPDGSGWSDGKGARWIFECIGDGAAVQDFWMPNTGGWGTNLRTYNPDSQSWEIVWAATGQKGLMHISAKLQEDGRIIMDILRPAQDPLRRIIFFPPDTDGWSWAQQFSMDGGETWFDVYRIRATVYEP